MTARLGTEPKRKIHTRPQSRNFVGHFSHTAINLVGLFFLLFYGC
jgi:hypothetical protein